MDAQRFDALVKSFGLSAARRSMVAGLLGGSLASLLGNFDADARRRAQDDRASNQLAAEKRKKKKKKKKKKPQRPRDEAPPCTANSCPLPPGCSQQAFDTCSTSLIESLQADAEPCRPHCQGGNSPACQQCLEPIVRNRLSAIEACAVESCSSPARAAAVRRPAEAVDRKAAARDWWVRQCDKPCCSRELQGCKEDAAETYALCLIGAVAACFTPAAPVCAFAIEACFAKALYDIAKCNARYGCPTYEGCKDDNTCCPAGQFACANSCCSAGSKCCDGGGCCQSQDVCCRMTDGTHYCCSGERGLTCKVSGGPTCIKA